MEKFNQEFLISFRDVDITGHLTISTLVDFMQETARNHATQLGVEFSSLEDENYWIVLRTKAKLENPPYIGEKVRIETYIEGLEKLYSVRRFNIYNEVGQNVGYIIAYYLLMNKVNHRPMKLKNLIGKESLFQKLYEGESLKKLEEEITTVVKTTSRYVYSSDIDTNHHMNNAHYIRWIMDMFSTEELEKIQVESIQIQYVKEVLEDYEIELVRDQEVDGEIKIVGRSKDGVTHFISNVVVVAR